ncbi:MAG: tetratricopeptide repeat protein [Magnetovibrio sp.]|nr:tetratricopeptide repeat protein [Magnetovibrio sp.]
MADNTKNATEDALIREVNDDLREEQMMKLWNRFGGYIIGAAVLIVIIVAGYQGWKQYDTATRTKEGDGFYTATLLAKSGKVDDAIMAFGQLSKKSSSGYSTLAQLQQAALMATQGDSKGAAALYLTIAKANAGDVAFGGLANVLGAMVEINTGGYDVDGMTMRLQSLSDDGAPYRYSARELLALVAMKSGDKSTAIERFKQLSNDAKAPSGIKNRAKNLVQYLGG